MISRWNATISYFRVGINKMDLLGEPLPGRRFKGKIWMMGTAHFA